MESLFGWMKTVAGFRRSIYVVLERTGLFGELVATAYNPVRMSNLIVEREAEVPVLGTSVPWARCALQTPVRALRAATETIFGRKPPI